MPYIPYTVDTSLSHPTKLGIMAQILGQNLSKIVPLWNFSMPYLAPPPPLTVQEVGSVVTSDKCIAKY